MPARGARRHREPARRAISRSACSSQLLPTDTAQTLAFALHWNVVGFAALLSIGTGLLFGLYPALQSTKPDLVTTLRAGSGKLAGERVVGAVPHVARHGADRALDGVARRGGLFVKSLVHVATVELGLSVDHVVTFAVSPELNGYKPRAVGAVLRALEE